MASVLTISLSNYQEFFENPAFRADGLKIYPTLVIRGTGNCFTFLSQKNSRDGFRMKCNVHTVSPRFSTYPSKRSIAGTNFRNNHPSTYRLFQRRFLHFCKEL